MVIRFIIEKESNLFSGLTNSPIHTYPLSNTVAWNRVNKLHFLPENSVLAPTLDQCTSLDSKNQYDDEANKDQEAQDNCYDLQDKISVI